MRLALVPLALAALGDAALAQNPPTFRAELLTANTGLSGLNDLGEVIGYGALGAATERAWVVAAGRPLQLLPLPPGRVSSRCLDINEQGVIVGAVGAGGSADPTLGGVAAIWTPNGAGGYTVQELGRLPGHIGSIARAINNVGDVLGDSQGTQFRRAVRFTANGPQDLTSFGVFDPQDVNDNRVVVCYSTHCSRFDLNTMTLQDLGVPAGSYTNTLGYAINDAGQVAGVAILATGTSCDRAAARYTDGVGWEVLTSCNQYNGAGDINARGDVAMFVVSAAYLKFDGLGEFAIQPQIVTPIGTWQQGLLAGALLNDSRQVAIRASNATTGQSGVLLLTPLTYVGAALCAGDGIAAPCPCGNGTAVGLYEGCRDSTGAGARLLAEGTARVSASDLEFQVSQASPLAVGLLVQGVESAPRPVYDGLLCVAGPARRLEVLACDAAGHARSTVAVAAAGGVVPGDTRVYQVWFRDQGGPCGTQANVTPALRVTWN